ncbi:MAG: prepilin-type N-terminal cleavage/methylation domain-containing protein [Planctomycetota bacterium]
MNRRPAHPARHVRHAFSMIELLVVIAIIALLIGLLAPGLGSARRSAQTARCMANQRQLITAWTLYADDHAERVMPLAYTNTGQQTSEGDNIFWWGADGATSGQPDHASGFLAPYLGTHRHDADVFECPAQPRGSYASQGAFDDPDALTSTYGYNGYYLSPEHTPGWNRRIGWRPWRKAFEIQRPSELFVFADTLILFGGSPRSTALLDPPALYQRAGRWRENPAPTTAFRHNAAPGPNATAVTARADGAMIPAPSDLDATLEPALGIGSASATNAPHYVPDWQRWAHALVR